MKRVWIKILKAAAILLGGVTLFALFWFSYLGLTILFETKIFHGNPQDFPQDMLRNISALVVCALIIILMSTKLHEIVKGMLLLSGIAIFIIVVVLRFYTIIWLAILLVALACGLIIWILINKRTSWFYYLALAIVVFLGLLYAWPRWNIVACVFSSLYCRKQLDIWLYDTHLNQEKMLYMMSH